MEAEVEEVLPKEDLKAEASDLMAKFDPSGAKAETPFARNICLGEACLDHKIPARCCL